MIACICFMLVWLFLLVLCGCVGIAIGVVIWFGWVYGNRILACWRASLIILGSSMTSLGGVPRHSNSWLVRVNGIFLFVLQFLYKLEAIPHLSNNVNPKSKSLASCAM